MTASDGSFRISGGRSGGRVLAMSTSGQILWTTSVDLRCSAPLALVNEVTVVTGPHSANWLTADGRIERSCPVSVNVDDSGGSPNVVGDNILVLGACCGEVMALQGQRCWEVRAPCASFRRTANFSGSALWITVPVKALSRPVTLPATSTSPRSAAGNPRPEAENGE